QLTLTVAADDAGLRDGVMLEPVRAQPVNRLGPVANEPPALQLEHPERPDEFGLLRRAEVLSLRAHNMSDRERIPRVGLSRSPAVTLAVCAPRRNLEHLKARTGEGSDQAASEAAGALNPNHRRRGAMVDEPVDEAPISLRRVRGDERRNLAAAVIDQSGGAVVLVNVDTHDQNGLLFGG